MSGLIDSPRERQRLYWLRISTAVLESVPIVVRRIVALRHASACKRVGALFVTVVAERMDLLVRADARNYVPEFVSQKWKMPVDVWDFSACYHALANTWITPWLKPPQFHAYKTALKVLNDVRTGVAAHPSQCRVRQRAQHDDAFARLDSAMSTICNILGYDGIGVASGNENILAQFRTNVAALMTLELRALDVRFEQLLLDAQQTDQCMALLDTRIAAIETRGAEFARWLEQQRALVAASLATATPPPPPLPATAAHALDDGQEKDELVWHTMCLTAAFDALLAEPCFLKFDKSLAAAELQRFSKTEATRGKILFAVRASTSGAHAFSVDFASNGALHDTSHAVRYDPSQRAFVVATQTSGSVIDAIWASLSADTHVALNVKERNGFYKRDEPLPKVPIAPVWQPTQEWLASAIEARAGALEHRVGESDTMHVSRIAALQAEVADLRTRLTELTAHVRTATSGEPSAGGAFVAVKQQCVARLFALSAALMSESDRDAVVDCIVTGPSDFIVPLFSIADDAVLARQLLRKIELLRALK